MNRYLTDTMALVLRIEKRKLPKLVKNLFEKAENEKIEIIIPAIVFAEIGYLSENGKIDTNLDEVKKYIEKFTNFIEQPLTFNIIRSAFYIGDIPELHDRLIGGTGKEMDIQIITNDPDIQASHHIKTIWDS